jgi:hypothetical protein
MTSSLLVTPIATAPRLPRVRRLCYEPERRPRTGRSVAATRHSALAVDNPRPAARAAPLIRTALHPPDRRPHANGGEGPKTGPGPTFRALSGETRPEERAETHRVLARHLRTALEVLDGHRPIAQLADLFAPPALRYWLTATRQHRGPGPARFIRMRLCLPRSGVAEVAVTVEIDGRPRALAARFERRGTRWLCTAVRLG